MPPAIPRLLFLFLFFTDLCADPAFTPPDPVENWLEIPDHIRIVKASAVEVDSRGRIYIGHRGEHPILVFKEDGRFLRSMGNDIIPRRDAVVFRPEPGESAYLEFVCPDCIPDPGREIILEESMRYLHGLHVDREDNLWVTDVGSHTVLKFNPEGKLLMTLGSSGESGAGKEHFNQPTDVTLNREGEIFVSDGYINSRVVKFSPEGEYLDSWGERGNGPGEFNTPHAITIDEQGILYVSDRTNFRIQRFTQSGKYLGEWTDLDIHGPDDGEINDLHWGPDGLLYLGNGRGNKITVLNARGEFIQSWGGNGLFKVIHGIFLDPQGNLYVAEVQGHRVRKFIP